MLHAQVSQVLRRNIELGSHPEAFLVQPAVTNWYKYEIIMALNDLRWP